MSDNTKESSNLKIVIGVVVLVAVVIMLVGLGVIGGGETTGGVGHGHSH